MHFRKIGPALLVTVAATTAFAIELPQFDVRAYCASVSGSKGCQDAEKNALSGIAARWAEIPEQRRHFCVQTEAFRPRLRRSYVKLAECLNDEKITS